jgi:catechol 2,3-dioxygenase-like lactoylglutathione lyase family enzyme
MGLMKLEHYTVKTGDLAGTISFYENVLGMKDGERPPFLFPGAWIYCGDTAVVHLIGDAPTDADDTGALDHIAFQGQGLSDFLANLDARDVDYRERDVPATNLHQVFVEDPNGVTIEINFRGEATG